MIAHNKTSQLAQQTGWSAQTSPNLLQLEHHVQLVELWLQLGSLALVPEHRGRLRAPLHPRPHPHPLPFPPKLVTSLTHLLRPVPCQQRYRCRPVLRRMQPRWQRYRGGSRQMSEVRAWVSSSSSCAPTGAWLVRRTVSKRSSSFLGQAKGSGLHALFPPTRFKAREASRRTKAEGGRSGLPVGPRR